MWYFYKIRTDWNRRNGHELKKLRNSFANEESTYTQIGLLLMRKLRKVATAKIQCHFLQFVLGRLL